MAGRSIQAALFLLIILFGLRGCSATHEESDQHNPAEKFPDYDDYDVNPPFYEFIQNQIGSPPDIGLVVHCQSLDDDLGIHILFLKQEISWKFRMNIGGTSSTYFWCKMAWHDHEGRFAYASFDVFRNVWYNPTCHQCHWAAREDGVFLNDEKLYDWEFYDLQ